MVGRHCGDLGVVEEVHGFENFGIRRVCAGVANVGVWLLWVLYGLEKGKMWRSLGV